MDVGNLLELESAFQSDGKEVAWAIALKSLDEDRTVVWTMEIARAREVACPIWASGDKFGARAAFLKAYEAILLTTTTPPRYQVSPGHNLAERQEAYGHALTAGLLSHNAAQHHLPAPEIAPPGTAIADENAGQRVAKPQDNAVESHLAKLRVALNRPAELAAPNRPPERENPALVRRQEIEARKREVQDYIASRGYRSESPTGC